MNVIGDETYVSKNSKYELRTSQFKPCGSIATLLSKRPLVLKIGKLLFCHAGLKKYHLDILDRNNKDISYINNIWKDFVLKNRVLIEDKEIFDNIILGNDGILWTRNLDEPDTINQVLTRLECVYMFIGHTPMNSIKLLNNQIWYTDTGLSRSFGTTSYQYIDINNYNINVKTIEDT